MTSNRVELQKFLSNLVDDLWAQGIHENIDKFVVELVHPRINYLPRRITGASRHTPNRYGYQYADAPSYIDAWDVVEDCWEVVRVSRKRYNGVFSVLITANRIPGA